MSRIVLPRSRSDAIVCHARRRASGSKPVVGSSRKTISGSPTSASPRSRRRRCPPERRAHERVALLLEADELDDVADRPRLRVVAGEQREILGDGEAVVEGRGLEDDADPLAPVETRGGRVLAEHGHRPAVALAVALEDLDGRRLAGAVRAEQPEDLALRDLEADSAQRLELLVGLAEIVYGHGARHIWPI